MAEAEPDRLRRILGRTRTIGMVGASPDAWRPSFGIMRYLQSAGFRVVPVNPTRAGEMLHGETIVRSLADAPVQIDLVNVFRRSDAAGQAVNDAVAIGAAAVWLQLGVIDEAAAARGRAAGLDVVMDRCISVEHGRLRR